MNETDLAFYGSIIVPMLGMALSASNTAGVANSRLRRSVWRMPVRLP